MKESISLEISSILFIPMHRFDTGSAPIIRATNRICNISVLVKLSDCRYNEGAEKCAATYERHESVR